jgi:hypothetical protein
MLTVATVMTNIVFAWYGAFWCHDAHTGFQINSSLNFNINILELLLLGVCIRNFVLCQYVPSNTQAHSRHLHSDVKSAPLLRPNQVTYSRDTGFGSEIDDIQN